MNGLGPGVDEARAHPDVLGPGGHQPPAQPGHGATPCFVEATDGEVLGGGAVVTGAEVEQGGLSGQRVEVVKLLPGQLLGKSAAHGDLPLAMLHFWREGSTSP